MDANVDKPIRLVGIKKNEKKRTHEYFNVFKLIVFLFLTFCVVLIAFFAEKIVPYDPYKIDLESALQPPTGDHILGTDRYGRDMLSRVVVGAKTSIFSSLILVFIVSVFGTTVGMISGYVGGKVDALIMRVSEVFLAFPGLVFAIAVAGVLGGGLVNAVIALTVISWPKYARLSRGQVLSTKKRSFIAAAKISGCNMWKIVVFQILPNIVGPILITAILDIGTMMMELASLSFLGLGAMPPAAEWGSMISDGRSMIQTSPWVVFSPGLAIFVSVALFNLLGDTVRDVLDPKSIN